MDPRICFYRPTVNRLAEVWQRALQRGDRPVIRRATALLLLAEQVPVPTVAARVGVRVAAISGWRYACLVAQFASPAYRTPAGRPAG